MDRTVATDTMYPAFERIVVDGMFAAADARMLLCDTGRQLAGPVKTAPLYRQP